MTQETVFEESSGNVFADLGLEDAEELFNRGKIGIQVLRLLKQRNLGNHQILSVSCGGAISFTWVAPPFHFGVARSALVDEGLVLSASCAF